MERLRYRFGPRWREAGRAIDALATGAGIYLILGPLVAAAHQALLALGGAALAAIAESAGRALPLLPIDPVYGGAALHIVGGITVHGLALAGPLGDLLHSLEPSVFQHPSAVPPGAVASAVLEPGGTLLARGLATAGATIPLVALGIWLARWSLAPPWLACVGVLLQSHLVLVQIIAAGATLRELEATGLAFALAALSPVDESGQRVLVTGALQPVPDEVLAPAVGLAFAAAIYAAALLALALVAGTWRAARTRPSLVRPALSARLAASACGLAVVLAATPLGALAEGRATVAANTPWAELEEAPRAVAGDPEPGGESPASVPVAADPAPPSSEPQAQLALATTVPTPTPLASGSAVEVRGRDYRYRYLVNGEPTVIRGMGYNPWYSKLDPVERRARYDRDFAAMSRIGVNTIEGWFESEFDEVTLDVAQAHGLGVIMPFELNQDYDYADLATQERFRQAVAAWVVRYRNHPAVRMWGPGNEMMHRLIYPTIVRGARDPDREARADAFASFYVGLIDLIHALDPKHPVVYRDAEDLYLARIRGALLRDGVRRPWFVYGTNAYTERIQHVIAAWPSQGLDAPLLVSEFAPGGVGPADRPSKLAWFWSVIRSRPEMVLGGVVYTWATAGPEDLDRVFGLTDAEGKPVDGSIAMLSRLFHADDRVGALGRPGGVAP